MRWLQKTLHKTEDTLNRLRPLRIFDHFLLTRAPTLWRLRAHDMLGLVLLAHAIAFVRGYITTKEEAETISITDIARFQAFIWWGMGIVGAFWVLRLVRVRMLDTRLSAFALSFAVTVCASYAFLVLPNAYIAPLSVKMQFTSADQDDASNALTEAFLRAQIQDDLAWLSNGLQIDRSSYYNQNGNTEAAICGKGLRVDVMERVRQIYETYGLDADTFATPGTPKWDGAVSLCSDGVPWEALGWATSRASIETVFDPSSADHLRMIRASRERLEQFPGILQARLFAADFADGTAAQRYVNAVTRVAAVLVALALGGVVLVLPVVILGSATLRAWRPLKRLRWPGTPSWRRNLDRAILRKYPLTWAFGPHRSFVWCVVLLLGATLSIVPLSYLLAGVAEYIDEIFGQIGVATANSMLFVLPFVALFTLYIRQVRAKQNIEVRLAPDRHFAALWIPPTVVGIVTVLFSVYLMSINIDVGIVFLAIVLSVSMLVALFALCLHLVGIIVWLVGLMVAVAMVLGLGFATLLLTFGLQEIAWAKIATVQVLLTAVVGGGVTYFRRRTVARGFKFFLSVTMLHLVLLSSCLIVFYGYLTEDATYDILLLVTYAALTFPAFVALDRALIAPELRKMATEALEPVP